MKKSVRLPKCHTCGMPKDAHLSCPYCYGCKCKRCLEPLFLDESVRFTACEEIHQRCKFQARPRPAYMSLRPFPPEERELVRRIVGINDDRLLGRKLKRSPQAGQGRRSPKPARRSKVGRGSPMPTLMPA